MRKLKIGMIGAGFIGQLAHLMNFIELSNCQVVGLAEFKPVLREKVANRYRIPRTYASHTELLCDDTIEAVIVVTPRPLTGPVVLDCLRAGKHVLSEKPMAASAEQAELLLAAAEDNQVSYAVGYMKRYDEGVMYAKEVLQQVLASGKLGTIMSVHAKCYMGNSYCNAGGHVVTDEKIELSSTGWPIAPNWLPEMYHPRYSAYLNTHSHLSNLLRYLFNDTPSVEYVNLTANAGQLVVLNFKQCLAILETGKMSHQGWSEEVHIIFTDGEIHMQLPPALLKNVPAAVQIYNAGKTQEMIQPYFNWTWAFKRQAQAFVDDVLAQRPMLNSAAEAYQEILLIESIWQAELARLDKQPTLEIAI